MYMRRIRETRMIKSLLGMMGAAIALLTLPSCLDDDDSYSVENSYSLGDMWVAVATVVPEGDNTYYLRLDNGNTLWPAASNYPGYKPKADQRAFVNFTILADSTGSQLNGYSYFIKVNAIHDILTKPLSPDLGAKNDSVYGTDPVSILDKKDVWVGDGYLNVYFETYWGGKTAHYINLIHPSDEVNPYAVEFRHNAFDDPQSTKAAGRVAFNLASLPDTEGKTVDLIVRYKNSENGRDSIVVKYNTNKSALETTAPTQSNDVYNMTDIQ